MKKIICLAIALLIVITPALPSALAAETDFILTDAVWQKIEMGDGLYSVYDGRYWGYINPDGTEAIRPVYSSGKPMREGLALVGEMVSGTEVLKFIDNKGSSIIDITGRFGLGTNAGDFSEGLAPVYPAGEDRTIFINKEGEIVLSVNGYAAGFSEGLSPISTASGYGYIDNAGNMKISAQFDEGWKFNEGRALVFKNGLYGIINKNGAYAVNPSYEQVWLCDNTYSYKLFSDGLASVKKDGKWGAVSQNGTVIIPFEYDMLWNFAGGYAGAQKDGNWGIIKTDGSIAVNLICQDVTNAVNGFVYLKQNNEYSLYNLDLKQKLQMTGMPDTIGLLDWQLGTFYYTKEGKTGIIITPASPSDWAKNEVYEAYDLGLVPEDLKFNYTSSITRAEFCRLAINLIEVKKEVNIKDYLKVINININNNAFSDTDDETILAANALGIVLGRTDGTFGPGEFISRQEAAAMLTRTSRVINPSLKADSPVNFADKANVGSWALEFVDFVSSNKIMNGNTQNQFMPTQLYSREQSYLTFLRLYSAL